MRTLTIAAMGLRRFLRDGRNLFGMFVMPVVLILLLGAGSADVRLGVLDLDGGQLSSEMIVGLQEIEGMDVRELGSRPNMVRDVERGQLEAGLVIPRGYQERLEAGAPVELQVISLAGQQLGGPGAAAGAVVTEQATLVRAARFAEDRNVASFGEALAMARRWQTELPPVEVTVTEAGEAFSLDSFGGFDVAAHTQLVLFTFFVTLIGANGIIQSRRLGLARRMLATPASVREIILGEGLARLGIALTQGLFIMIGSWAVFGVTWGDPVGAGATLLVFAFVAAGAAMLLGAVASNEEQAGGLATLFGLGLAALGGAMMPLAVFRLLSDTVYRVAHITPHAWAIEAFEDLVAEDAGLIDIAPFLLILVLYAIALFTLAAWRLRTVLSR